MSTADHGRWPHKILADVLGFDQAVSLTLLWRLWLCCSTPVTLFFVASRLRPVEQGFYFTFSSMLALKAFFDLGFSNVLLQFASHERAHLEWNVEDVLTGPAIPKTRLRSLVVLAIKWYGIISVCFVACILPIGLRFFESSGDSSVSWRGAWVCLAGVTALQVFTSPLISILEGCGLVAQVAGLRFTESVLGYGTLWIALLADLGLYGMPIMSGVMVACEVYWLCVRRRKFFRNILGITCGGSQLTWSEVWPLQWRIGLSWMSGYLIFQLFSPVLFTYWGPVAAGQMGMSVTIAQGLSMIAIAMVNTKAALFGRLVALRRFAELDSLFYRSVLRALTLVIAASVAVVLASLYLRLYHRGLSGRIVGVTELTLLVIASIVNTIVFAEAIYLRAHKREPFLAISVTHGIVGAICTYVFGRHFGAVGISGSYVFLTFILGGCWGTRVFVRCRREWHCVAEPDIDVPGLTILQGSSR